MNTKIIISQSTSRFLDNLKIAIYHHKNDVDAYIVDMKEIFKAYDIIKPDKIYINYQDLQSLYVEALYSQLSEKDKSKFVVDNNNFTNVVNKEIFRLYSIPRNDKMAVILDNIDSIPEKLSNLLNSKNPPHMFNNPKIKHTYNLGMLLEHQKAFIFSSYKHIIGKNNLYKNETILCGASYIDIDSDFDNPISTADPIVDISDYIVGELYVNK